MVRLSATEELRGMEGPLHLALGVFDGVHLGHQAVIGMAVAGAKTSGGVAGVMTFEPHPIRVLAPEKAPRRILASIAHKERLLAELGVEVLLVLEFTPELARQAAEEFGGTLLEVPGLKQLTAGEDWKFGRNRGGTMALLREWGTSAGVEVNAIAPVMLEGERVSSTRVRQALRDGNLAAAAAMLGRPYTVMGEVIRGEQLGSKLGVPTANIEVGPEQLPPDGVYAVQALWNEAEYPGVANLGVRPTVDGKRRLLEVHLFDFQENLYSELVEIQFGRRLRGEQEFGSLEELTTQIFADVAEARTLFEAGTALEV